MQSVLWLSVHEQENFYLLISYPDQKLGLTPNSLTHKVRSFVDELVVDETSKAG